MIFIQRISRIKNFPGDHIGNVGDAIPVLLFFVSWFRKKKFENDNARANWTD